MSRIVYAALGKPGIFVRDNRYAKPSEDAVAPMEPEDAAKQAYRAGYEDGQLSSQADFEARLVAERAARGAIELAFARFDAESQHLLRERLLTTVQILCEEAILPLTLDTDGLVRRVEAAAAMLQRKHDRRIVHLHPADLDLVREHVRPELELVPDGSVERGGLRVETEDGGVEDGPLHWRRALAEAFETCTH